MHNGSEDNIQYIGRGKHFEFDKQLSIIDFIEKKARQRPNHLAINSVQSSLTYSQLNQYVNQFANYLTLVKKIQPQNKIAIYLIPSIEMIVSILAILKVGCSYIPLDVNYPPERINFMLRDSHSNCLIGQSAKRFPLNFAGYKIFLDEDLNKIKAQSTAFEHSAKGSDIAYIIYTSGSTGVPKGVIINHSAVNNHMLWLKKAYKFNASDKILLKTPISFDPSVWEIFLPLYAGCEMIIAPQGAHIDPELLVDLIVKYQITSIQLVPALLEEFLKHQRVQECNSLKRVFVGGESLRTEIKSRRSSQPRQI